MLQSSVREVPKRARSAMSYGTESMMRRIHCHCKQQPIAACPAHNASEPSRHLPILKLEMHSHRCQHKTTRNHTRQPNRTQCNATSYQHERQHQHQYKHQRQHRRNTILHNTTCMYCSSPHRRSGKGTPLSGVACLASRQHYTYTTHCQSAAGR